jgi:glycosyltransferase involved in cell wall biosynthesis
MTDRRVMVVAYTFPPVAGTGIERTLKHVTYLPEFGWQPVVVAPANPAYRLVDPASVERIPAGTEVHRAPLLEPAHARRLLRRLFGSAPPASPGETAAGSERAASGRGLRGLANAAWARVIPALFFPDEQLLWAPSAALVGWRAHRRRPVDLIYSSALPITSHLAAGLLRGQIGVPWVADFRDSWIGNPFARRLGPLHRRLQARLERWIVSRADRSVFATVRMRDRYASRYPGLAARFVAISNGYDPADLPPMANKPAAGDGTFRLVYTGSLYGTDELPLFLDGIERLRAASPDLAARLRVEFIGWFSAENQAVAVRRLSGLEPIVRHVGYLPRPEALRRLADADAALILIADGPGRDEHVGTKLYEYIGVSKPVLAVAPRGEARATLEELDWGVAVDPTPQGVASGLERILEAAPPQGAADPERRYERRTLSGRLADLFDEVLAGHPPS